MQICLAFTSKILHYELENVTRVLEDVSLSAEAPHLGCGSQALQELTHYEHVVCIQKPETVETSLLVKVQQGHMDLES